MPPRRTFQVSLDHCGFLQAAYEYLQSPARLATKGLFRESAQKDIVEDMLGEIVSGARSGFSDVDNPHLVAGVVRRFFIELAEPPIPFDFYSQFVAIHEGVVVGDTIERSKSQIDLAIKDVSTNTSRIHDSDTTLRERHLASLQAFFRLAIPPSNLAVVRALVTFLNTVSADAVHNLMTPKNLSSVFGPSLANPRVQSPTVLRDTLKINHLVELMISEPAYVFAPEDVHL
jgi:hypothetical protein